MTDLSEFDDHWPAVLRGLAPEMHPVDRDACFIWFQFFPLALHRLCADGFDRKTLETFYQFRGTYRLSECADTSHRFLHGHRYWPAVKSALQKLERHDLAGMIRQVASQVPGPSDVAMPISAIGLMTLRQCGDEFLPRIYAASIDERTPEQVLRNRATDYKSGWFSRLKPRVIIDESESQSWFPLIPGQHITTAAELDKRPYHQLDPRCAPGNGAIPVDCRTGTCGTCWVGILGGNDQLLPVDDFERKRMAYFGYWESPFHNPDDPRPLVRLACQSVASGSCSIVIPPWNGVWSAARREAFARQYRSA